MAINGNLKDMSFVELLRLVGKRTGRLCVFDFDGKRQYEWYLNHDRVCAVRINQKSLTDDDAVYQTALTLAHDSTSSYIFYKLEALSNFPFETQIPLDKLMTKSLSMISASTSHSYAQHFPHPDTKFEAITNAPSAFFDETLRFWEQNADLLRHGASASEIAGKTLTDVEQVRVEMYKLKLLGAIRPIRAFAQASEVVAPAPGSTAPLPPLNISGQVTQPIDERPSSLSTAQNAGSELKSAERKSLVSRMLSSLFGKQKPKPI